MAILKAALLAILCCEAVTADQCAAQQNAWNNGVESGACLSQGAGGAYGYHCPWESDGLASGFGCSGLSSGALIYDCTNQFIGQLATYYEGHGVISGVASEWGPERTKYTYNCIVTQCPALGKTAVATSWTPTTAARLLMV